MIYSYSITPRTLAADLDIIFAVNEVNTGCTVTHVAGTPTFTFNKPGYYYVTFNGIASATAAATDPIAVEMYDGANAIPGALSSALSAAADTPVALSMSTIIQVRPNCPAIDNTVNLTVRNVGIEANYTNAAITITKLC
jgi:phage tail sheath gpL-like